MLNKYFLLGCLIWGIIIFIIYSLRTKSRLHSIMVEEYNKPLIIFIVVINILICIIPMSLPPVWNGEIPDHRNQYELLAEALLDGHIYIDYDDIDVRLLEMENPYDAGMRAQLGINYHWDHAFYNGRYYVYFGIVPVLLLFLPYRIITGTSLITYHATQVFVALFIIGVFALFYIIAEKFFRKLSLGLYLLLSSGFAIMSVWYSTSAPALYCTTIAAGICMEIWSLFFFVKAVFYEKQGKKSILYAFWGSLAGALAFGCRPPTALANILVIPLLAEYLRDKKINLKLIMQLIFAAIPYIITAALLMLYNYLRFDNPFEFGQSYQLTLIDQTNMNRDFSSCIANTLNGIHFNFISYKPFTKEFPYVAFNSVYINFPILIFSIYGIARKNIRNKLKESHLLYFSFTLFLMPFIITIADALGSPFLIMRYQMDIYWLLGLMCFIIIGFSYESISMPDKKRKFSHWMSLAAFATILTCILLYFVPNDSNVAEYFPQTIEEVKKIISLGLNGLF